jgi:hypothetical protein
MGQNSGDRSRFDASRSRAWNDLSRPVTVMDLPAAEPACLSVVATSRGLCIGIGSDSALSGEANVMS